jgi:HEPN domain-containing protein/predicted nucleotidyltransferase
VEKSLKGLISLTVSEIPRTHKLSLLYKSIFRSGISQLPITINEMKKLEIYTYIARYPFLINSYESPHEILNLSDSEFAIYTAEKLLNFCNDYINNKVDVTISNNHQVKHQQYWDRGDISKMLDEMIDTLVKNEKYKVQKVILFGDYARDLAQPIDKTIDILTIVDDSTKEGFIDRTIYINSLFFDLDVNFDFLVYTRSEFDSLMYTLKDGFFELSIKEGRTLFSK